MSENKVTMIDLTPTWSGILPALLNIIETRPNEEAYNVAREELKKMAKLADNYVRTAK